MKALSKNSEILAHLHSLHRKIKVIRSSLLIKITKRKQLEAELSLIKNPAIAHELRDRAYQYRGYYAQIKNPRYALLDRIKDKFRSTPSKPMTILDPVDVRAKNRHDFKVAWAQQKEVIRNGESSSTSNQFNAFTSSDRYFPKILRGHLIYAWSGRMQYLDEVEHNLTQIIEKITALFQADSNIEITLSDQEIEVIQQANNITP